MPETHLMTVQPRQATRIMTGQQLVEARLSTDRRAPYNRVQPGDIVYIRPSGHRVIGRAVVHRVDQYSGLTPTDIERLERIYNDRVGGDEAFWRANRGAKYATFITLTRIAMLADESSVPTGLPVNASEDWCVLHDQGRQHRQAA